MFAEIVSARGRLTLLTPGPPNPSPSLPQPPWSHEGVVGGRRQLVRAKVAFPQTGVHPGGGPPCGAWASREGFGAPSGWANPKGRTKCLGGGEHNWARSGETSLSATMHACPTPEAERHCQTTHDRK